MPDLSQARSCDGKAQLNKDMAVARSRETRSRDGDKSRMSVYECLACGFWHYGHAPAPPRWKHRWGGNGNRRGNTRPQRMRPPNPRRPDLRPNPAPLERGRDWRGPKPWELEHEQWEEITA